MIFLFFMLVLVILYVRSFMLMIIMLEIMGFVIIWFLASCFPLMASSDYLIIIMFSVLVMESVIALSGLISMVSFSGTDYLSLSSLAK